MERLFDAQEGGSGVKSAFEGFEEGAVWETESLRMAADGELCEIAPSTEVQALEIRDYFVERPELQFESWAGMSAEERVHALQGLENCCAEVGKRPPVAVEIGEIPAEVLRRGQFSSCPMEGKRYPSAVTLDQSMIESSAFEDYRRAVGATIYEGRHAYQLYNVYERATESSGELVKAWRENLTGCVGYQALPEGAGEERQMHEFRQQPVEVDTSAFRQCVMEKLGLGV